MNASLATNIIKIRKMFAEEFKGQQDELDWICFSSLPPSLIEQGYITLPDWYRYVRQKLREEAP